MFGMLPAPAGGWKVFQEEDTRVTEMQKYFANCHKAIKVAMCNEIYAACERTGVDYSRVRACAVEVDGVGANHTTVPNEGKFGFAGSCFPKDMLAFSSWYREIGGVALVFEAALASNEKALERNP